MMKYFTMDELTRSETAQQLKLDNTPTEEHRRHLTELAETLLDPLREQWEAHCKRLVLGKPGIRVSSGYRGFRLNQAVRGAASSAHCHGYAANLIPLNGNLAEFKNFCRRFMEKCPFDQMISESENKDNVPVWIHIGLKDGRGAQCRQFLTMRTGKYYPMTK